MLEFPYNASAGTYAASGTVIVTVAAGGLALDTSGDLFVSNPSTSHVQEYLFNSATGAYAATGIIVAGTGGSGSGTNQLSGPTGVAVDHSGDLFVFDAGNARVMEFTGNQASGAYAANGTAVFAGGRDNYPETGGVALDSRGDVFYTYNFSSAVVYESVVPGSFGLPFPWTDGDVGSPAVPGSATFSNGVFTVNGSGTDIWGSTDQFNYVSEPLTGNGSIEVRLTAQSNTSGWAKSGVMIKQSTTNGSNYALLAATPGNGIAFQSGFNASVSGGSYTFPVWLKLTRSGSTITANTSTDGTTWTTVGTTSISLTDPITIGLFTCAHNGGALNTATFDNVSVTTSLQHAASSGRGVGNHVRGVDSDRRAVLYPPGRPLPDSASGQHIQLAGEQATDGPSAASRPTNAANPHICAITDDTRHIATYPESTLVAVQVRTNPPFLSGNCKPVVGRTRLDVNLEIVPRGPGGPACLILAV